MSFKTTSIVAALVTFVLGAGYLFVGPQIVGRWRLEPTASVLLMGRRIGALYLGLSVMFFLARCIGPSSARTALSAGTMVACILLALTGVQALSTGLVSSGMLISVAVEILLAVAFLRVLISDRKLSHSRQ